MHSKDASVLEVCVTLHYVVDYVSNLTSSFSKVCHHYTIYKWYPCVSQKCEQFTNVTKNNNP